jgi:hypothetical protein
MVADNDGTQDQAADYNREGQEWAARDGRDSGVAMMAATGEEGGGGQQQKRWTTTMADNNGIQDWAADYDREGRERAARDGGDSGVAMMAVAVEDGGGGQFMQRRMATADNDSDAQQRPARLGGGL